MELLRQRILTTRALWRVREVALEQRSDMPTVLQKVEWSGCVLGEGEQLLDGTERKEAVAQMHWVMRTSM